MERRFEPRLPYNQNNKRYGNCRTRSFKSFGLIPFQINPHYLDANPAGHAGETREQRIEEFIEVNPGLYVVGLREGTMLLIEDWKMKLIGPRKARIFLRGNAPAEMAEKDDMSFLLG
ncbi:MAG: Type 1 glutamine amidotransferase-like domain-containing protein [Marinilabiliales bacterium]|nr:Type 1 glutamine amidotransferase-like domain-containing protein [Marinilabiliales bacterium]